MKLMRPLVVLICLLLLLVIAVIWWNSPARVDMSNYAPADALVYIEMNSVSDLTSAIQRGNVLKAIGPMVGFSAESRNRWILAAVRAGIAPAPAVVSSRAQLALVVLGINTAEQEESLRVKPEVALIVETQTARWRMKSFAISSIKKVAEFAYGNAVCTERVTDSDYVECVEPKGSRKIVGAIDGTVVILSNSDKALESCLEVRRGKRPSLHTDVEFGRSRANAKGETALAFGYVSQTNAARLFSLGAPLLVGKAPGDQRFESLLSTSAGKILRGISWTTKSTGEGFEDRYQIFLDADVVKRLEPAFQIAADSNDFWRLVPDSFRSVTVYRSKDLQAGWVSLDSAVALKLDAVSSVIIASLLRSGLSGYGIENPRDFLASMSTPLVTLRPSIGEDSLLLGRVKKDGQLRRFLSTDLLKEGKGQILNGLQSEASREKEFTAVFLNGFVVLGKTETVLVYLAQLKNNETVTPDHLKALTLAGHPNSTTVTFTNERPSILTFLSAVSRFNGRDFSAGEVEAIERRLPDINFSSTATNLNADGIERETRSALGQFGNLLSLAVADSTGENTR